MSDPIDNFLASMKTGQPTQEPETQSPEESNELQVLHDARLKSVERLLAEPTESHWPSEDVAFYVAETLICRLVSRRRGFDGPLDWELLMALRGAVDQYFEDRKRARVEKAQKAIADLAGKTATRETWEKIAKALGV